MNVSLHSGASSVWSLLASRAASASSGTGSSTSSTSNTYSSTSSDSATTTQRPDGPPPPPSQFDCPMSTRQFAGQGGGEDPIASLDADDDGSVSADEFGLDGASEDVQDLFAAIDGDGSGDLSTDEIDAFREQMMQADGGRPPEPPMGPPPGAQANGGSSSIDDSDEDSITATASNTLDVSSFIQQLAQRYASLTTNSESESALSVTA